MTAKGDPDYRAEQLLDLVGLTGYPSPVADHLLVLRDAAGPVTGSSRPAYATVDAAKRSAILRNAKRDNPAVWWVVADRTGTPLHPQP